MSRNKNIALALSLLCFALPAAAAPTQCIGTLPPGTYDAITVPAGQGCGPVFNLTVTGNVVVEANAALFLFSSSVGGNLVGQGAGAVHLASSTVAGNITLDGTGPTGQSVFMGLNLVGGNVSLTGTESFLVFNGNQVGRNLIVTDSANIDSTQFGCGFFVDNNSVAGHLIIQDNTGPSCKQVVGNVASKQIHCDGNDNFSAFGNTAAKKHGQCQ